MTASTYGGRPNGGLPAEVTSFVGRRHEVAEVKQLLSASRAVTLTGVGGVGKTRLAVRVGQDVRRAFRDGVWLVELAELDGPAMLAEAVAEALEIRDHSGATTMGVLTCHLRDKQALLILDNCEHMIAECAALSETLLRAAPDLRVLATSRQAMGISGEQAVPVAPLPLPDLQVPLDKLIRQDAVRLFAERARAVLPSFTVSEGNREVVTRIVRLLDGLPLAIELAAVRLRALSVAHQSYRLSNQLSQQTAPATA
ncbi:NB-ARC domain-containing protein, partial [Nonomuraea angiospora]|uniref:ATP-binding protein n=1 Tax=Nonomuraea angiospora TaxID=46172 RepID=UPI00344CA265